MKSVTVIIPAFNEERTVGKAVRGAVEALSGYDVEILVIDDGSTDSTAEAASRAGATVVRHAYNKGNGAAVKTGLRNARHSICAIFDADGQHAPETLPRLLDRLKEADMVVGTRTDSEYSRFRGFGNWVLNHVAGYLSGHAVPDLTSGLRVFRRDILARYSAIFPNRFSFPSTSTLALLTDGYSVVFEPIVVHARAAGSESSIRPYQDGLKFLAIIFRIVHQFNPLKLYLPLGALILVAGALWSIKTVIMTSQFSAGGILLLLTGLIIILMGFQIDQVSALRRQICSG